MRCHRYILHGSTVRWPCNSSGWLPSSDAQSRCPDRHRLCVSTSGSKQVCLIMFMCALDTATHVDYSCMLLQRRRSRRRTVPSLDSEDPRSIHLQRPLRFQVFLPHIPFQSECLQMQLTAFLATIFVCSQICEHESTARHLLEGIDHRG